MSTDMALFQSDQPMMVPDYLQGTSLGVGQALMAVIGDSRNRIGLKGSRFRQIINGQEVGVWDENYLDVIIVGVVPHVSRIFYAGAYSQKGDNAPPACYSVDGVAPPDDVLSKQADTCALCPQNVKGSKVSEDGHEGKACGFFRRMVIMLPGDATLYVVDVKSQGVFGDSDDKAMKFSMNDYAKFLQTRGVDASQVITRLRFDTDVSVPKLFFTPSGWVSPDDVSRIRTVAETNEIQDYLKINFKTIDLSKEQAAPADDDVAEAAQPVAQAAPKPTVQTAPRPTAQPVPQTPKPSQTVQQAPKPTQTAQAQPQAAPKPTARPAPKPVGKPVGKLVQAAPARAVQGVLVEDNVAMPTATQAQPQVQEVGSASDLAGLISELGL